MFSPSGVYVFIAWDRFLKVHSVKVGQNLKEMNEQLGSMLFFLKV